jgi:hypothetical protein
MSTWAELQKCWDFMLRELHLSVYLSGCIQNVKVFEFENKNARPWICKEVLESPYYLNSSYFSLWIIFVQLILHVHIWQSCLKSSTTRLRPSWTIQSHILLISNVFSSVFSPWIYWYMALNVLRKSLNLTLPGVYSTNQWYKPWFILAFEWKYLIWGGG